MQNVITIVEGLDDTAMWARVGGAGVSTIRELRNTSLGGRI